VTKYEGTICIRFPHCKFWGMHLSPVIFAHNDVYQMLMQTLVTESAIIRCVNS